MTGQQLRKLREDRGLTRPGLAEKLGSCSVSSVVKWEHGINPVPDWVAEKMTREVTLTLPIEMLGQLITHAQQTGQSFDSMLYQSIRDYIAANKIISIPQVEDPTGTAKVAEDDTGYGNPKK